MDEIEELRVAAVPWGDDRLDNNIMLNITAEQQMPTGETNRMEMVTEGRYFHQQDAVCLEYQESETSGLGDSTTTVMVSGDIVSVLRRGAQTSHMVFSQGKKSYNIYQTPVGAMEMAVLPLAMETNLQEESGEIHLEYELELGGNYIGENLLSISYRRKGSERLQ